MPLSIVDKKAIVAEVADVAAGALSVVAADYRGLSVSEMNELRANARNAGVYLRVVRNTLARRAMENTDFDCLKESLLGPVVLAFAKDEPGAAARLFRDFAKKHNHLEVKGLSVGGQLFGAAQLEQIASLPTRDEALSQLLSVMKAPIGKFARTLSETYTKLVRTVAAVGDQKGTG